MRAPAKVNLSLRVVGRREDGYHLLESLIVPVTLYDDLVLLRRSRGDIVCRVHDAPEVPAGPENLVVRAAQAVFEELGCRRGLEIDLYKRIPAGAGLGGGSSDAAAVLRGLPPMLGRRINRRRLLEMAAELGADVPFFVGGTPALVSGIGERLSPIPGFPRLALVIAVPKARVETRWAFAHAVPRLTSEKRGNSRAMRSPLAPAQIVAGLHNDLEAGVSAEVEDVRRLGLELRRFGALGTVMSGSGSAVVGVFESLRRARDVARRFSSPDVAWAAYVLRRSPTPIWF